ncbi:MAG: hypothetical protein LBG52_06740 [Candidatus Peribacteria bacterium]|nr:hypothetical protein [Candidatus Peribacteria bacterium]
MNHLKATTCLNATTHPNATTHLNAPKDSPIRTLVHHPTISNPNIILLQTKHTIRAVNKRFLEIQHQLFIQRAGLPIFKVLNNGERKPLP